MDQRLLEFIGIDADELKKQLSRSDSEALEWIQQRAKHKSAAPEIIAWSAWQERRAPDNPEGREYFNEIHKKIAPHREDIVAWFDLLDADDFASFGGKL